MEFRNDPKYAKRSGQKSIDSNRYFIDGEYLTARDIAARLSLPLTTVQTRMNRERAKDGPVTLAGIAAASQ